MLELTVQVPDARDRTAVATLRDGPESVASDHAAASAMPSVAARHANPACDPMRLCGHPPLGTYRLLSHEPAGIERAAEYGAHLLLFEPQSGAALDAESFGRLGLLVYGGASATSLRRTQGGLRLTDALLGKIVERLRGGTEMALELVPLRQPSWWQFWKSRVETLPLPERSFEPLAAPLDELSVLEAMLQKSPRRERVAAGPDDSFDRHDRSDRSSSGTSSEAERFQGGGGATGGAGASGSWAAGERGVDSAGRIIAGAAAVGAIAAVAAAAAHAHGASGDSDAPPIDTTTNTAY